MTAANSTSPATASPGPLLALSAGYWKSCALHAAVALDVFSPLAAGPATARELASGLGCDARALDMLLTAMCGLGLLSRRGDAFALAPQAAEFLVVGAPRYQGHIIRHHKNLVESFGQMEKAVRQGGRVRGGPDWTEADRQDFQLGMFNLAMGIAPRLAPQLDALLAPLPLKAATPDRPGLAGLCARPGGARLLDLGGGPGTYAIHFCLAWPGLAATVFDQPATRPFAEATARRFGLEFAPADETDETPDGASDGASGGASRARLRFVPGDYTKDALPGGFHLAWLSHILHGEGPDMAAQIVRKAADALEPGGVLMVHEFLLNDSLDGPEFPALFSLNMLLGTQGGQAYSARQLCEMLAGAGLAGVTRLDFSGPNDSGVVAGVKP